MGTQAPPEHEEDEYDAYYEEVHYQDDDEDASYRPPLSDGSKCALRWAIGSALLGLVIIVHSHATDGPAVVQSPAVLPMSTPEPALGAAKAPTADPLPRSRPTRLRIPAIGVSAPFTDLTLQTSGALNAPPAGDNNLVGWYRDGTTPGERGNAIVAGHVDTKTGPAVFANLGMVRPGHQIEITRADGTVATFSIDAVETFAKTAIPDSRVYGATRDAQLRLITCGGSYNRQRKDYTHNVVVFAHLTSSSRKA